MRMGIKGGLRKMSELLLKEFHFFLVENPKVE